MRPTWGNSQVTPLAFIGEGGDDTFAGANPMLQGTVEEAVRTGHKPIVL